MGKKYRIHEMDIVGIKLNGVRVLGMYGKLNGNRIIQKLVTFYPQFRWGSGDLKEIESESK
ncbi:hypothetical protein P4G85_31845 [Bacillus cereus]|uniref:Uncharacterized protein n=1 Tax=Bacillus cereus VD154 TaxID=1053238 RepID=A0A9W5P030_BACCE|nr:MULTISPECIES: hypothetical protein [Bacillus cereus group]MEB8735337.1 hypothetical protein [Bacillus cereus]EJR67257.1 hypothetical protein IK5_05321 [Bacillus cereus VD154]MEB8752793.1 hypothetical protein [Bacillus cereus]MEB8764515.1 hypothetical protein [Bacillus cereus]MEB8897883.1 hypothetical protein [Bacillus cereus]